MKKIATILTIATILAGCGYGDRNYSRTFTDADTGQRVLVECNESIMMGADNDNCTITNITP